ncbi:hypothetical protein GCM10009559_15790 [Pseudonocardia zijingensis]|uniref:Uncharacterized protein n=1 Tax=Pseudonocardia zijingensis TaxID=153376 RepID=A0ABN1PJL6_9PSEU
MIGGKAIAQPSPGWRGGGVAEHDRPTTLAWVRRHLAAGERIVGVDALRGGITAEMQRLTVSARLYWRVRDAPAASEEVQVVSQPWREAGRTELTTRVVEARLDAYLTAVLDTLG